MKLRNICSPLKLIINGMPANLSGSRRLFPSAPHAFLMELIDNEENEKFYHGLFIGHIDTFGA